MGGVKAGGCGDDEVLLLNTVRSVEMLLDCGISLLGYIAGESFLGSRAAK